ncbi:transporter substrate-binding domain-containing protein [Micromonospora sp. WMMD714]|uniref:transporter substrate-binding domain-containing protein n=1 Tax=Micromonospora sp. WMMD714 TaxID=3016097 RepID=UPI00249B0C86|nr:transporter substrate-binding domain-containing protein [Micromonospora sp. WMMD714]WFE64552.1 transporter substrate-binding domain-containing protein [Micromonospora sp. WMMD714]
MVGWRKWSWVGPAFVMLLAGCPAAPVVEPTATPTPAVRPGGPLVKSVGVDGDQPGFSVMTGVGKYDGFDAELVQWLTGQNNWNAKPFVVASKDREKVIQEDVDGETIVISTYSITDKRREVVGMAGPYLKTQQGVLVRAGDKRIRSTDDLQPRSVCTVAGTTSEEQLGQQGVTRLTLLDGFQQCVDLLKAGQVDAVSTDLLILHGFVNAEAGAVEVVPDLFFGKSEEYGIGFKHGDTAMCKLLTASIKEFIRSNTWRTYYASHHFPPELEDNSRPNPDYLDPC